MAQRSPSRRATRRKTRLRASNHRIVAAAIGAAAIAGCGGSAHSDALPAALPSTSLGSVRVVVQVGHRRTFHLPTPSAVSFDRGRRHVERAGDRPGTLNLGHAQNLIISSNPAALLLHRLAELHARLKPGQFPIGADARNRLHIAAEANWNSGFYAGALWQAAALRARPFTDWALAATLQHLGHENRPVADVGFMYGQSSLLAYQALCRRSHSALCLRLKDSVLAAAKTQLRLYAGNRRAGMVPSSAGGRLADSIIDNMMNVAILPWASRVTGDRAYERVALRHARRTAALLVRPDGSTIQAVNFNRKTGRTAFKATHQGISERSTWSRGQAWGVYGFGVVGLSLRDRGLVRVGERLATYVEGHLPAAGVPRWDYEAGPGAPLDVSAGVITSAGLFHLSAACRRLPGACRHTPAHWSALGRRMLAAALRYASPDPPLGFLGSQELNQHARGCWCNGAELTLGLSYALEAVKLAKGA